MSTERIPITSREKWLTLRHQDCTASEIGAVAGCSPYKTPLEVYGQKRGWLPEAVDNAAMQRGRLLEPVALEMLRERRPEWTVVQPNTYLRDPDLRLGGTPDAIAYTSDGEVMLEVKSMMAAVFDRDWQDGPPLFVELQTLTNAMLWGAVSGVVAALVIDRWANLELFTFDVPRNAAAEEKIREIVWSFWSRLEAGIEPRADYKRDAEVLAQLRKPIHKEPTLDLSGDNILPVLLEERAELLKQSKSNEERLDEIKCRLVDKLAGHQNAALPGWRISNKTTYRPEKLVRASEFAVLRVTRIEQ